MDEQIRHERLEGRVTGFEDHETLTSEEVFEPAGKRGADRRAGLITLPEPGQELGGEFRGSEQRRHPIDRRPRVFAQCELRDGQRAGAGGIGQLHIGDGELAVEDARGLDLVPVVIFDVHPEHRHGGHVMFALYLPGELDRRHGLQDRVERPAEDAGLLARDDGD